MDSMKTLDEIAIKHGTDKATVHAHPHGYTPFYSQAFAPMRYEPVKLMEIGVGSGESIRTWLEYFPNARVHGVDIANQPALEHERYTFTQGDQSKPEFWKEFTDKQGSDWSIIVDDGGHFTNQIVISFNSLWAHIRPGGYYCIEDLGCGYNTIFLPNGFPSHVDYIRDILHHINKGERGIGQLHFSRELAIIQKK